MVAGPGTSKAVGRLEQAILAALQGATAPADTAGTAPTVSTGTVPAATAVDGAEASTGATAPTPEAASLASAAREFAYELYAALRDVGGSGARTDGPGNGHGHAWGHRDGHGWRGQGYGSIANRLDALAASFASPVGDAPVAPPAGTAPTVGPEGATAPVVDTAAEAAPGAEPSLPGTDSTAAASPTPVEPDTAPTATSPADASTATSEAPAASTSTPEPVTASPTTASPSINDRLVSSFSALMALAQPAGTSGGSDPAAALQQFLQSLAQGLRGDSSADVPLRSGSLLSVRA